MQSALRTLGSRDRFSGEVRRRLEGEGFSEEVCEFVLGRLRAKHILNDEKAARLLVEKHSNKRAVSAERLRAELESFEVSPEIIDGVLGPMAANEADRALAALTARYKEPQDREKAGRFLYTRGFSEEDVEAALNRFFGSD